MTSPDAAPAIAASAQPDALMVFDGVCNFCAGYVRAVTAMDHDGRIHFTSIQSRYGTQLCRDNDIDLDDPSTFLFVKSGEVFKGTDAMIAMFDCLPAPWRWLRALAIVPHPLRDAVYRWTARNRYNLLGKRSTCIVPSPQLRARFYDDPPGAR